MAVHTVESIEKSVIAIVKDLIQDWGLDANDVSGGTKLAADLEFASVDIIQLCVAIEQYYGQKMGFQGLLMKDGSYVPDLSLAQMAEFVNSRINLRHNLNGQRKD